MGFCLVVRTSDNPDISVLLGKFYGYAPYVDVSNSWDLIYDHIEWFSSAYDPVEAYATFNCWSHAKAGISAEDFRKFITVYAADKNKWLDSLSFPVDDAKIDVTAQPLMDMISSDAIKILEWS